MNHCKKHFHWCLPHCPWQKEPCTCEETKEFAFGRDLCVDQEIADQEIAWQKERRKFWKAAALHFILSPKGLKLDGKSNLTFDKLADDLLRSFDARFPKPE